MVLERYYLDGQTVPQIAADLQISDSSIRALISRLRANFRSRAHGS
jgi:DNA-directed RNA polymerase specialized sigma24 family protein